MSTVLPDTTVTSAIAPHFNHHLGNETKCNCDAYITWINAQLFDGCNQEQQQYNHIAVIKGCYQRAPNGVAVKDLGRDLRNGVVLAKLTEKLSGEPMLDRVHPHPVTRQQMLNNVDEVLRFAARSRVKMHSVLSSEIVDGDIRSTLRLILALAAHFRPTSVVRQQQHQIQNTFTNGNNSRPLIKTPPTPQKVATMMTIDSKFESNFATPSPSQSNGSQSPPQLTQQNIYTTAKFLRYKAVRSPRHVVLPSPPTVQQLVAATADMEDVTSALVSSSSPSIHDDTTVQQESSFEAAPVLPTSSSAAAAAVGGGGGGGGSVGGGKHEAPDDPKEVVDLQSEIATAKKTLLALQQMLLEQTDDNDDEDDSGVSEDSKKNLEQAVDTLQMRTQIRELQLTVDELSLEKEKFQCLLIDRDRQLGDLQKSLFERDQLINRLQTKLHELIHEGRREVAELKELAGNVKHNEHKIFRLFYFNEDAAGPFAMPVKSSSSSILTLKDVKQSFARFGRRYRFFFLPIGNLRNHHGLGSKFGCTVLPNGAYNVDPMAINLELESDQCPIPFFDTGIIYCRLQEIV